MAPLLDRAAVFATMQGEYERARHLCNRACASYEQAGDEVGLGKAIHALGVVEHRCGNFELARDSYAKAIERLTNAKVPRLLSTATANLAGVYIELDDLDRAEEGFAESLRLAESIGDLSLTSSILLNLANVEMRQNRMERAENVLLRALEVKRKLRSAADIADALAMLAIVAARQKQTDAARGHAEEALRISSDLKSNPLLIKALEAFVQIAVSEDNYRLAARLLGLTESLRRNSGIRREAGVSDAVATIKGALSSDEFKVLAEQGAATSPEDEVAALLAASRG
jgi:tetratricopeptide (TPR) repeat protein